MRRLANLATMTLLLGCPPALGFDYTRYQATDLDALMTHARPQSGIDIHPVLPLRLEVTLISYREGCQTGLSKKALVATAVVKDQDALPATRCIKVRSAKGQDVQMFIQDVVSDFLPKEVSLGGPVTLFAIHVYTAPDGPGLLVNEFTTEAGNDPTKSSSSGRKT